MLDLEQVDIAKVDGEAGGLADDEHWVAAVDGVAEQHCAAGDAEVPKRGGDDAALDAFACQPLHDKARGEQSLADEADDDPDGGVFHGGQMISSMVVLR